MLVVQKHKNEWFALIIVAYNEDEDIIEIDEYNQIWNIKILKNLIPLLLCQTGGILT